MKTLLPEINSADKRFHAGNPATGEQGTRVTDTWLNDVQDRVRDMQAEAHYVLTKAGFTPKNEQQTQLYQAIVKIIDDNRKSASVTQKGEVQLYSGYDSDSVDMAATPKVIKVLKGFIDSVTRSLTNYIPNSKKSNEVNSSSADTVATSAAVKTAYDKGVAANNNAEGRVSKSGDRLTGILYSVGISSKHFGYGPYANQYTSGAPFMVEATGSQDRNKYHPFVKGLVRSKGRYGAGFSFGYTTKQGAGDGFGRGVIHLIEDNGANKIWAFEHNGDFVSANDVLSSSGRSINKSIQKDEVVGEVAFFARTTPPSGWLKANGAAVSRTTYAALFAAIGTTFGAGDGRTTFNLPDLRGEFLRGLDDGRNIDRGRTLGTAQGDAIRNITGKLDGSAMGSGNQVLEGKMIASGAIGTTYQQRQWSGDQGGWGEQSVSFDFDALRVVPIASENRPRNVALLACIKY
ncbi:phage tail protein [Pasteurella multocida]